MTRLVHACSAAEAISIAAAEESAAIIAGGTAMQLDWAKGIRRPQTLISLARLPQIATITPTPQGLRIGALATLGALERDPRIAAQAPLLAAMLPRLAGPAVRNLATIGGNIAGCTGCLLPALLALDTTLELQNSTGEIQIRLQAWLARPRRRDDILLALHLPRMPENTAWLARKTGLRASFTPSVITVAGMFQVRAGRIRNARLAVGGGMVPPARLAAAEAMLEGATRTALDRAGLHAALLAEIQAPSDAFRTGTYRRRVAANAIIAGLTGLRPPAHPSPAAEATPPGTTLLSRAAQPQRWHTRPDGPAKIAGSFAYLTDHRAPGMLVGRILRANIPHARILRLDTSRAEALPGVHAVVTHRDVPGLNAYGIVVQDQPAFCADKVRHAGDVVAAIAAIDAKTADAACALIDIDYDPLPPVTDPEAALLPDAPRVHDAGNLQRDLHFSRGDIAAGFAACTHVVEETYITPRQMHGFMETEGGWAEWTPDGRLHMHAGGQHGPRDRLQLARILAIPQARISVVSGPTGGAFGGKDELTVQPALALLARKSGRPVRLQLSRAESVLAGLKRNPMRIRMRTGCTADGIVLAQQVDVLADCGAYASLSPGVLETALEHAAGPYDFANIATRGRLAYTNNGLCGAFRGFGANQMAYAVECQMDRLAALCGLHPTQIRQRNLKPPGTPGYFGQTVAPSERLAEMLQAAAADPLWQLPRGSVDAEEIIGVGMAMNYHGNGLGSALPDPGGGALQLAADGGIEAVFTLDEMGQGLHAAIVNAVSAALGCARADIRPVTGRSDAGPDSGSTTASRGTYVVWRTASDCGGAFSTKLCSAAAGYLGREAATLKLVPGGIGARASNSTEILLSFADLAALLPPEQRPRIATSFDYPKTCYTRGNARFLFVFGACIARVAVNRITGMLRVLDLHQHSAAGPVLDIAAYLGQQEGGAIQGMGFTLSEDAIMQDGHFLTRNLDTYMMPGIADAPAGMRVHALEALDHGDDFGPRGAGELGIGAVTPAIANAVRDAIGACPPATPLAPESLLAIMESAHAGD